MQKDSAKGQFHIFDCFVQQLNNVYFVTNIEIKEDCLRTRSLVIGERF